MVPTNNILYRSHNSAASSMLVYQLSVKRIRPLTPSKCLKSTVGRKRLMAEEAEACGVLPLRRKMAHPAGWDARAS
jgi:hypothetical protein